jgi:uncharacterized lipoprotein YddW (UPF0748 family)
MEMSGNQNFGVFPIVPDGDWRRLCRELKALGVNAIFPNVVSPSGAIYPSNVVGILPLDNRQGQPDLLMTILSAAHAEGLEVHPWTIEWAGAPPGTDPDRLVHDAAGNTLNSLCPSVVENRNMMRDMIMELVTNYGIDGVHYDSMRWPGPEYCYCRHCRVEFEKSLGSPVANWPQDVLPGGQLKTRYDDYRYQAINSFVRDMYALIKQARPEVLVSAAVWCSDTESRLASVGQDWGEWVRSGWLDFIAPMNYGNNWILWHYGDYARNEAQQVAGRLPLVFGLGAYMDTPGGIASAVELGRELNGAGAILYTLTALTYNEHLPFLYSAYWSEPAVTVQTAPVGLNFSVDGITYAKAQSFEWTPWGTHTIAANGLQTGMPGTRYIFSNWSDNGAISHTLSASSSRATYTASFGSEYQLTTALSPVGNGLVSPVSGTYYPSGAVVNLKAFPNKDYTFVNWTGPVADAAGSATTVTMTGPVSVTANLIGAPLLSANISAKTGAANARVWTITLSNSGRETAAAARLTGLTLAQTGGAACSPLVTTPASFPLVLGDIAPGGSAGGGVTINFSGCAAAARFTATIPYGAANGGAGSATFYNQYR